MTASWGINFNLVLAIWFLKLQTDFKIWANLHVLHLGLEFWNFALSASCKLECKLEWMRMVVRPSLCAWENFFFCLLTIEEHDCYWRNSCSWKVWLLGNPRPSKYWFLWVSKRKGQSLCCLGSLWDLSDPFYVSTHSWHWAVKFSVIHPCRLSPF